MQRNRPHTMPRGIVGAFPNLAGVVMGFVVVGIFWPVLLAQDAEAPSGEPVSAAVLRDLVSQLGHASSAVRDEAAKKLVRQGSAAKEVLNEALANPDSEIQTRARLILDRMLRTDESETRSTPSMNPAPTPDHRELVRRLGDHSFFTREKAAEALVKRGGEVKAALVEALKDPDFEIRWRARQLLNRVLHDEFEKRLADFIADVDGTQQQDLPGWQPFRELVGDGQDVREFFTQMMRTDGELLTAYAEQSPDLPELFAARATWLQANAAGGNSAGNPLAPPKVATLLLIGSDETVKDHSRGLSQIYQLLCREETKQSVQAGRHSSILHKLLNRWVASAASKGSMYAMMLALKYDLKETALQQATKVIDKETPSTSTLHYAIIAVGRFGGEEHIRLLKPLLENRTVCHRWSNRTLKQNGTIDVQVRDAALVILLHLQGKEPAQFGFKLLRENPETLYYVYTFGFIDEEEREAAHAKWAADSQEKDD